MKSYSLTRTAGAFVALIAVITLLGISAYGEAPSLRIPAIKGTISGIDMERNCILINGCEILGSDPLYLRSDTCVYDGYEGVNFDELKRNAMTVSALDRTDTSALQAGCEVSCTYSYSKDGKFIAKDIVIEKPSPPVPSM